MFICNYPTHQPSWVHTYPIRFSTNPIGWWLSVIHQSSSPVMQWKISNKWRFCWEKHPTRWISHCHFWLPEDTSASKFPIADAPCPGRSTEVVPRCTTWSRAGSHWRFGRVLARDIASCLEDLPSKNGWLTLGKSFPRKMIYKWRDF